MSIAELILNSNLYFPHPFIKDYSHVKKTLLSMFATALLSGVAFNALADDANQGSGKITFKVKLSMHLVLLLLVMKIRQ